MINNYNNNNIWCLYHQKKKRRKNNKIYRLKIMNKQTAAACVCLTAAIDFA